MSSSTPVKDYPKKFGVALYPQFEVLDVYGPLEALNTLARRGYDDLECYMIAEKAGPVSNIYDPPNVPGHLFKQETVATKTFEDNLDLDVLIVPGGLGWDKNTEALVKYIAKTYPKLKYLFTICTGSGIAARANVLDGHSATTNKTAWKIITAQGKHRTYWVGHARWVESGNIWTTSGVSAGTDGMIAWISKVFGESEAEAVVKSMEYVRQPDAWNDPFAEMNNAVDVPPTGWDVKKYD